MFTDSFIFIKLKKLVWAVTYLLFIWYEFSVIFINFNKSNLLSYYQKGSFVVQMKGKMIYHYHLIDTFSMSKSLASPLPQLWFCAYFQYIICMFWCLAKTDGKVTTFLMVWKFGFMTTLNFSLLFDLTFWYFVLSAFLRFFTYNIFMAHCSDFLTPLMGVINEPYADSFCSTAEVVFLIIS